MRLLCYIHFGMDAIIDLSERNDLTMARSDKGSGFFKRYFVDAMSSMALVISYGKTASWRNVQVA